MSDLIDYTGIMPEYPIPSLLRMRKNGNIKEERKNNKSNYI